MHDHLPNPKNWSAELAAIEELCGVRGMTAGRLLRIMSVGLPLGRFLREKNTINQQLAVTAGWRRYGNGAPIYAAVPAWNRNMIVPSHLENELIVPLVCDIVNHETDAVVELGCGYGRHIFAIRDILEHKFARLRYYGGEISDTGRRAGDKVAALEKDRVPVTFHEFDFLSPSLGFLHDCRKVVFFTCHAIEQVYEIRPELILAMRDAAAMTRCVHSEPVGWQLDPQLMAAAESGTLNSGPAPFNVGMIVDNSLAAQVPFALRWNRNLVSVLSDLAAHGHIELEPIEINACGNDVYNPSTLLLWKKPNRS